MPRPKSPDAKRALTIRLRGSLVDRLGGEAKARAWLEAAAEKAFAPKVVERPKAAPAVSVSLPLGPQSVSPGARLKKR